MHHQARRVLAAAAITSMVLAALLRPPLRLWGQHPGSRDLASGAELVAPGIISTGLDELGAAFTPSGDTMYYALSSPGPAADQIGAIVVSRFVKGHWLKPEMAPFSGQYSDYDPFVSPDGKKLFFVSNRPETGRPAKSRSDYDIWVVERDGARWGEPRDLGSVVNSRAPEYYPSIAADSTLYFSTVRADSKGHFNLYRSHLVKGEYGPPENLGPVLNGPFDNIDNVIAPDQSFIIFTSYGRPDALGNGDLYISFNSNGSWTAPRHLDAPVNSVALDYTPNLSPDGKYLYWASNRGFEDRAMTRPALLSEFRDSMASIRNGNGNIYRTPLQPLLDRARVAAPPPGG